MFAVTKYSDYLLCQALEVPLAAYSSLLMLPLVPCILVHEHWLVTPSIHQLKASVEGPLTLPISVLSPVKASVQNPEHCVMGCYLEHTV